MTCYCDRCMGRGPAEEPEITKDNWAYFVEQGGNYPPAYPCEGECRLDIEPCDEYIEIEDDFNECDECGHKKECH